MAVPISRAMYDGLRQNARGLVNLDRQRTAGVFENQRGNLAKFIVFREPVWRPFADAATRRFPFSHVGFGAGFTAAHRP
ncbi:MAG: hypothetical protein ACI9HB_001546 [Gammaproteobacteria bacterium]|jgi:hypothetical protein